MLGEITIRFHRSSLSLLLLLLLLLVKGTDSFFIVIIILNQKNVPVIKHCSALYKY